MKDLYDVVVVEDGKVVCVTYWTRCDIERAQRLAIREQQSFKSVVGICFTGTLHVGSRVTVERKELTLNLDMKLDGRAVINKKKLSITLVEKIQ
jgi:hypothetical protein